MKKKSYSEKLLDPRWQRRKTEIQTRDAFTCQICARTDITLNVHHRYYLKGVEPWDYPDDALILFCSECHSNAGEFIALFDRTFKAAFLPRHLQIICETFIGSEEKSNLAKGMAIAELLGDGLLVKYLYERRLRKLAETDPGLAGSLSGRVALERH